MTASSPARPQSSTYFRVDTEHHLLDMMKKAVSRMNALDLDIQLDQEAVLLNGTVNCWHDKQRIQESVRGLSGSRYIENNLRVVASGLA